MSTREQPSPSDPDDDRPRPGKAAGRPRGGTVPPQSRTGEDGRTADGDGDPPSSVGRLAATVERLRRQVTAAHAAADGRALVELAKGVLVERLKC
ncbi:hypothetical protein BLA24_05310, partial [Streptomyces cinnamoneus]